jgi:hypothetical protein
MLVSGVDDCCKPGSTCRCSQWVRFPTDAPAGFRAPMGDCGSVGGCGGVAGVDEYAGRACLDVRNDKGNSADDPCDVFCGLGDLKSWQRLTVKLIRDARAGCHRTAKCQRVEELAKLYADNTSAIGMIKFVTTSNLINDGITPIARELACLITDAAKVGPHPEAPRPLPGPPPVGPAPSGWGGWAVPAAIVAGLLLLSQRD